MATWRCIILADDKMFLLFRCDASSVGFWVITLVIVRRERVGSSAREKVVSHLNARGRKLCDTIVVWQVI